MVSYHIYNADGKENTDDDDDVKVTYIWLSCTLAVVVTSTAVIGTTISLVSPVVGVICNLYSNIHPSLV